MLSCWVNFVSGCFTINALLHNLTELILSGFVFVLFSDKFFFQCSISKTCSKGTLQQTQLLILIEELLHLSIIYRGPLQ